MMTLRPARSRLTVSQVMAMVEVPAFEVDRAGLLRACAQAAGTGANAVLCRPHHVREAARALRGTRVRVGTAVRVYGPVGVDTTADETVGQAVKACAHGAGQLAFPVTQDRLTRSRRGELFDEIRAVAGVAQKAGAEFKVVFQALPYAERTLGDLLECAVGAGADVVQAGLWFDDDRAPLQLVLLMRKLLGPDVTLKWSNPVRSLDRLLLAHAEGVDRFNADAVAIRAEAEDRDGFGGGIRVPTPGEDYSWAPGSGDTASGQQLLMRRFRGSAPHSGAGAP